MDKEMIHAMASIMADHLFRSLGGDDRKTWLLQSNEFSIAIVCDRSQQSIEIPMIAGMRFIESASLDYSNTGGTQL